jgi:hypothetical protein
MNTWGCFYHFEEEVVVCLAVNLYHLPITALPLGFHLIFLLLVITQRNIFALANYRLQTRNSS